MAEAYELGPADVEYDFALLQVSPAWALCTLVWLKERHRGHAPTCVYYLATLHRACMGNRPSGDKPTRRLSTPLARLTVDAHHRHGC